MTTVLAFYGVYALYKYERHNIARLISRFRIVDTERNHVTSR